MKDEDVTTDRNEEVATLGAGCFWCIEAVLAQVEGVLGVTPGYMGGTAETATYQQVCGGQTGHVEVVQVRCDPARLSYAELLGWFWRLHDPTTPDRQGNDVGFQYRSMIFVHSDEQRRIAEVSRASVDATGVFAAPVVTDIADAQPFHAAEVYHLDYYRRNREQPYCRFLIEPKLTKLGLEP